MSPPSLPRSTAALDAVPLVSSARRTLASSLRSRVAGDDAAERARVIWDTPGERWFTPEDVIWRVHADASMFVGGIRALLVQSLHPLAMAGVAAHSGYKGDPWGRLQRTSTFLATTTFGTVEHAEAIIARVRAIHERVRGTAPDGRPYAASDPHLLRWVHITEVDSFLVAYQRFGAGSLTAAEADRYVAQAKQFTETVGVTGLVLTKLDGTAKGGIVIAVQRELGVPVKLVGLGEGPDDLAPFDPEAFVDALIS